MPKKLRITTVQAVVGKRVLIIDWENGKRSTVDLSGLIEQFPALASLQRDEVFEQASVGEWGFDVSWGDDIELAASTLYRLALEQTGEVMPTRDFKNWMAKNNLSLSAAAVELGFTRRTITAYSSGAALIPKHVALACRGWEFEHAAR